MTSMKTSSTNTDPSVWSHSSIVKDTTSTVPLDSESGIEDSADSLENSRSNIYHSQRPMSPPIPIPPIDNCMNLATPTQVNITRPKSDTGINLQVQNISPGKSSSSSSSLPVHSIERKTSNPYPCSSAPSPISVISAQKYKDPDESCSTIAAAVVAATAATAAVVSTPLSPSSSTSSSLSNNGSEPCQHYIINGKNDISEIKTQEEKVLGRRIGVIRIPSIEISEETGLAEISAEEIQSNHHILPKNAGGQDSETSEMGGGGGRASKLHHHSKTPSPCKILQSQQQSHRSSSPPHSTPQTKDTIPTDLSDTTESEPDTKVTGLVSGESVTCPNITTHHQGRELINTVFALPVDTVFTLLFTNSKFMLDLYTARKTTDVVASPWQSNPETNQKLRQVTYTLALPPNSFGPKVSHVTETQVVSPFSKHGEIYTVDAEACNAGIPYADSFFVSNHWCLTRESANETRLSVWSQVKYKKSVWGFMKGVIDKNSYSGVESLLNDISAALLAEVDLTNMKTTRRRRRRIGSKGEPPDIHMSSPIDKIKDSHKATQMPARKSTLPTLQTDNNMASNEGPVRIVVATLVVLLTLNALLYYKLWALEEKVLFHASPYMALDPKMFSRHGSGTHNRPLDEWIRILQHQEAIHAAEVERWRKSIQEAAEFLSKAEEALRNLHTSIPPSHASKIQLLLKQIKNMHDAESQYRSLGEEEEEDDRGSPGGYGKEGTIKSSGLYGTQDSSSDNMAAFSTSQVNHIDAEL